MGIQRNVIANFVGQGTRAVMGMAFIPLYVKYLGIESYGLIGMFGVIQAWLVLLDLGMRPALGREMARFSAGAHTPTSIRTLLRSVEWIALAVAGLLAVGVWSASGWLSTSWVSASKLSPAAIAQAFTVMGIVSALRFVENVYVSSIVGLQRQVLENTVTSLFSILRGLGALGVLAWLSPTIEAFFVWQGLVSLATVAVFAAAVYSSVPAATGPVRFSWPALSGVSRFASGMLVISLLTLLLTQTDKVLLSRLLSLEAFGYYALAGVVANTLGMLVSPITTALSPRLIELVTRGDEVALSIEYHQGSQFVTVLMGSAALVLSVFAERVLMLWTNNPVLTEQVSPLVRVLVLGSAANYLLWVPYQLQLAHGWTSLTIKVCSAASVILVPAILLVAPHYGAAGATWIWLTLNLGQLLFTVSLMHRRLLPAEKWRWYGRDVFLPLGAAAVTALVLRALLPAPGHRVLELFWVASTSVLVLGAAALAAPAVRHQLIRRSPVKLRALLALGRESS